MEINKTTENSLRNSWITKNKYNLYEEYNS